MIESVILSSWDHIMGPQIEKLWFIREAETCKFSDVSADILRDFNMTKVNKCVNDEGVAKYTPDMQAYSIMCGQLLLGEVDNVKPLDEWASRFYLSESNILIAVVFHLDSWVCIGNDSVSVKKKKDVCLCFGIIFTRKALEFSLANQHVIDLHLRKAVDFMQNSKISLELLMKKISLIVEDIAMMLESLRAFSLHNVQNQQHPSFQEFMHSDFVSQAIISHLQTSGCTVVIGGSNFLINQVIFLLSLFGAPKELYSSLLVPHFISNAYIEGIYIQGAIKGINMDGKYLLERAFRDSFSLTIVDTDLGKVWQALTVYSTSTTYRNTSKQVTEGGQLIPQLLKDLSFLQQNGGDSVLLVKNFYKHLMVRAAALIKAIEPLRYSQTDLTVKDVMTMFAIDNIVDLKILFGCAEKLKPGLRGIIS